MEEELQKVLRRVQLRKVGSELLRMERDVMFYTSLPSLLSPLFPSVPYPSLSHCGFRSKTVLGNRVEDFIRINSFQFHYQWFVVHSHRGSGGSKTNC